MAIYKFKVHQEEEEVIREIEIRADQSFHDLHLAIHNSLQYTPAVSASFYASNDQWIKGLEITHLPNQERIDQQIVLMQNAKLNKFIDDPHQKFYYISNFDYPMYFRIELIKIIILKNTGTSYPICTNSQGKAVPQFKLTTPPIITHSDPLSLFEEENEEENIAPEEFGLDSEDDLESAFLPDNTTDNSNQEAENTFQPDTD